MTSPPEPAAATLSKFNVHNPVFTAQSGLANVWKVQRADGTPAALKCYFDSRMPDERPGFSLLKSLNGQGAARLYAIGEGDALLEWLDGPSLGDLSRGGDDTKANERLIQTACRIHTTATKPSSDMPHLTDWFAALRKGSPTVNSSAQTKTNFKRAQTLAADLLARQTDIRPLHGDLHHDNIKQSARGDLAFDAKGIIGDRAYELANAFKNPIDADAIVQDPRRIGNLAQSWGQAFGVKPKTLLDWACVHAALSAAWHIRDGENPDMTMLHMLWDSRDASE